MPRPWIGLIDRYLFRELAAPFGLAIGLFTFFLVVDKIYQLTDLVITKGVPLHLVLALLAFMLPSFLALTLPMALLTAVLVAGGRLAGDLEIVALKAAGVGLFRLFRPILLAAVAVSGCVAVLTLWATPIANRMFQEQLFRVLQSRVVSGLRERIFNTTFTNVVIYVEDIDTSATVLKGLLVSDERDPKLSRIITATEGRVLADDDSQRIVLRLTNGAVNEADVMPAHPRRLDASPPPAAGAAASTRYRFTTFSLYDMTLPIDSPLKGVRNEKPERDLSLHELTRAMSRLATDAHGRRPLEIEWHKRLALPFAPLVFVLVGLPLAVRSHRGGRSVALLGSLVILVAYYLVLTSLEGMALRRTIPAWVAMWMPNVLFTLAGAVLVAATAREWHWRWPAVPPLRAAADAFIGIARRTRPSMPVTVPGIGARDSTHLVDRYVLREHLMFIGTGIAVAAVLVLVIDLLDTLDRYLRVKPPIVYVLAHFLYRVPADLHKGLPIVMLVATVFLFITLNRHHELTALKAAGVSIYRVALPSLGLGLAAALGAALFQELVLPVLNERGEEVDRVKIRGQLPRHLQSRQRMWVRIADSRFYRVELLAPGTSDLYGMTVLEIDKSFRLVQRLDARRAHWTPAGWELQDGAFRTVTADGKVETSAFERTTVRLAESIEDFTRIQKPVSAMSYRELSEYVTRLEAAGFQVRKYLVDLYEKLSFPLMNLVGVLVAIPFAVHSPRSGRLVGVGIAIAVMVAYIVVHYTAIAFARADLLPPMLGAWTANIIFAGVGISLFARLRT